MAVKTNIEYTLRVAERSLRLNITRIFQTILCATNFVPETIRKLFHLNNSSQFVSRPQTLIYFAICFITIREKKRGVYCRGILEEPHPIFAVADEFICNLFSVRLEVVVRTGEVANPYARMFMSLRVGVSLVMPQSTLVGITWNVYLSRIPVKST